MTDNYPTVNTDTKARFDSLQDFCHRWDDTGPSCVVITQVDPDAIASAFAFRELAKMLTASKADIPIVYSGSVAHPQNRCILNRYDLFSQIKPARDFDFEAVESIVLVDSCLRADSRLPDLAQKKIACVIDHHRGTDIEDADFMWIEGVGACATLLTELIKFMGETSNYEMPEFVRVLLALGIYTDTKSLMSAEHRDREAFGWLMREISPETLNRFIQYPLPPSHFGNMRKALGSVTQDKDRLVANCGIMDPKDGDDLSSVADYLMRQSGVSLVLVWGIVAGRVRLSARNTDLTTPLDEWLRERFGNTAGAKLAPDGRGEGGAMLDLDLGGFWLTEDTESAVVKMVQTRINSIVFPKSREG